MTDEEASRARREAAMQAFMDAEDAPAAQPKAAPGWYPHPIMAGTVQYWDGDRWTDHVAPAGMHSPAGAQGRPDGPYGAAPGGRPGSPGERRDETAFVWTIALLPVLWLPFDYFVPGFAGAWYAIVGTVVVTGVLAIWDEGRLGRRGIAVNGFWAFVLVPIYLIQRTRKAGSTPFIHIVWFFGLSLSVLGTFTFASSYEFDGSDAESIIEQGIRDDGYGIASVDCPDDIVRDGDVVWCSVRQGRHSGDIRIDIIREGLEYSFEWQVR